MRRHLLRALRVLLFAVLPFVLVELVLRAAGYHPPADPFLAGFAGERVFERDGDRMVVSPSHLITWRAEPFPAEPVPGALRVFVVGDSIAWGHRGNEFAEPLRPFASFLQDLLRERLPGAPHQVVNCGARTFATRRVRAVVDELLAYRPDAVVVYVGTSLHLETILYREWQTQATGLGGQVRRLRFVGWLVGLLTPERRGLTLTELRERDASLRAAFVDARSGLGGEADRQRLLAAAAADLTHIADACAAAGVPLVLATVPSDLRFPPMASAWAGGDAGRAEGEALVAQTGALLEAGQPDAALPLLTAALARDPEAAALHFRHAQAQEARGELAGAGRSYRRARDTDACPARALSGFNDLVRGLVAGRPGVHLVDLEGLFERAVPDGIPDERLFLDNCHPREELHARMAEALFDALVAAGVARPATAAGR
jgi:lysophospholipase L1-like esterase